MVRKSISAVLAIIVAAVAAPAGAAWHRAKSAHFIIYVDAKPGEVREFAEKLERFDQAVRVVRRMEDPRLTDPERVTIYVLPNRDAIAKLSGRESVAGFYRPSATGSLAFVPWAEDKHSRTATVDPLLVFFHEYAHHLQLQDNQRALPSWLVEGFAEFFGTAKVLKDGSVEIGRPPQHRYYALTNLTGLTIEEMVGGTSHQLSAAETQLLYSRGWLLTHFLAFEKSREGQLTRYIDAIQSGRPALDAARAAFGDLKQLDRELRRYAGSSFAGIKVNGAALAIQPVRVDPLTAGEAAIMNARIRSKNGVDATTAPKVAADARKAASAFPNDPSVQATLAEAEHDANNYPAALAAADRALAVDPRNIHALIYKGRVLVELAKTDRAKADWGAIRNHFIKANKIETENAEPLMLYHKSFLDAGQRPTADAVKGLEYALALVPQDRTLRINVVRQMIRDNRFDQARVAFAPMAFDPHASETLKAAAQKVMAALATRDSKSALDALDAQRRAPARR